MRGVIRSLPAVTGLWCLTCTHLALPNTCLKLCNLLPCVGGVPTPGSPQGASERSLDDMLEELQSMDQAPTQGRSTQQTAADATDSAPAKQGGGSTTTKKLDALLVELSTFKPALPQSPPAQQQSAAEAEYSVVRREEKRESRAPKPPATFELDSMLAELGSEVKSKGVDTTLKGCCAACSKPIHGKLLTAMSRTWHPEHFVCAICEEELANKAFYELEGRPYCEKDYNEMLAPRCAYCNGPILEVSRSVAMGGGGVAMGGGSVAMGGGGVAMGGGSVAMGGGSVAMGGRSVAMWGGVLQWEVEVLQCEVGALQWEVEVLQCEVGVLQWELEVLQCEVGALQWEVGVLQWEVGVLQWEVGALQWEVEVLQWEVEVLQWEVGVLQWEVGVLQWEVGVLQWEVGVLQWEVGVLI